MVDDHYSLIHISLIPCAGPHVSSESDHSPCRIPVRQSLSHRISGRRMDDFLRHIIRTDRHDRNPLPFVFITSVLMRLEQISRDRGPSVLRARKENSAPDVAPLWVCIPALLGARRSSGDARETNFLCRRGQGRSGRTWGLDCMPRGCRASRG